MALSLEANSNTKVFEAKDILVTSIDKFEPQAVRAVLAASYLRNLLILLKYISFIVKRVKLSNLLL